ncbi:unnamed protein product [Rhizophagus irregularis]|uniref:Uncharacterized protein n=1 Tax=Rhizophagus irregularis TaxID=588596 RepID=A0A916A188_9GLOM|nr:unnamed protein product [Rhizophagus irregularis]
MNDTITLRRWRIFQLILSTIMLSLEISNIILYDSFNPTTDIKLNNEFQLLRDKNRFIISIVCLPTILISIALLVYVTIKGEKIVKRVKLIQKADKLKNIEIEVKQSNGLLDKIISRNINSILLFTWSLTVILNTILFHKNRDLLCNRLEEKERNSILCNDFIASLVLSILMFLSCIYITFMKLYYSSHDNKPGYIQYMLRDLNNYITRITPALGNGEKQKSHDR